MFPWILPPKRGAILANITHNSIFSYMNPRNSPDCFKDINHIWVCRQSNEIRVGEADMTSVCFISVMYKGYCLQCILSLK